MELSYGPGQNKVRSLEMMIFDCKIVEFVLKNADFDV